MSFFNLIFIIILVIGFIIIIFSLININKIQQGVPISHVDKSLKDLEQAVNQADLAIDDLNNFSNEIFNSFKNKQKDLMFLYNLIDNKKEDKSSLDIKLDEFLPEGVYNKKPESKIQIDSAVSNQMIHKINELLESGLNIKEIAKILNMGQGEVKFILELNGGKYNG